MNAADAADGEERIHGEESEMGRPPLPLGTGGKVRFIRSGASWIARCGFREYDGITRPVERSGRSQAAAERALKQALRDRVYSDQEAAINAETKLSVVTEAWWKGYLAGDGAVSSRSLYRGVLDNRILAGIGSVRCRELTVAVAERFLRAVEHHHGRSLAKTTRTVLSDVCGFAARLGAMDRNPVRDTSRISTKPGRAPKGLSDVAVRQLRAYVTYLPVAVRRDVPAVIDVMAATGMRIGECLALTGPALDVASRTVQIQGTVARYPGLGVVFARQPKSEAGYRTLTLPGWVMPTVQWHAKHAVAVCAQVVRISPRRELVIPRRPSKTIRRRSQPPAWLLGLLDQGTWWEETITIVLPSSAGTFRDPSNTSHNVAGAFAFAGLSPDTSHLLRRSVATQMDDDGVPVRKIADQLGHARPSMTQDVYLDRNPVCTAGATALQPFGFPAGHRPDTRR
ncbi:tyrosine recombinase XerC [Actinoplanes sp. NPDC020271]|uniref:tyrosine recombinase XerC n=1 Tax=Actinoplanes sp. NPDC020271 TaxID=3363896 RepID=UPI00378984D1